MPFQQQILYTAGTVLENEGTESQETRNACSVDKEREQEWEKEREGPVHETKGTEDAKGLQRTIAEGVRKREGRADSKLPKLQRDKLGTFLSRHTLPFHSL